MPDLLPLPAPPRPPTLSQEVFLEQLSARALQILPGAAYNQHRQEAAESAEDPPLYFEAALPVEGPQDALHQRVLPTLARYLEAKSRSVEVPRHVVVALFYHDQCYLLPGDVLVTWYCELEGITRAVLHSRAVAWRQVDTA